MVESEGSAPTGVGWGGVEPGTHRREYLSFGRQCVPRRSNLWISWFLLKNKSVKSSSVELGSVSLLRGFLKGSAKFRVPHKQPGTEVQVDDVLLIHTIRVEPMGGVPLILQQCWVPKLLFPV